MTRAKSQDEGILAPFIFKTQTKCCILHIGQLLPSAAFSFIFYSLPHFPVARNTNGTYFPNDCLHPVSIWTAKWPLRAAHIALAVSPTAAQCSARGAARGAWCPVAVRGGLRGPRWAAWVRDAPLCNLCHWNPSGKTFRDFSEKNSKQTLWKCENIIRA